MINIINPKYYNVIIQEAILFVNHFVLLKMFLILLQNDGTYTLQGQPLPTVLIEPSIVHWILSFPYRIANLHPLFLVFIVIPHYRLFSYIVKVQYRKLQAMFVVIFFALKTVGRLSFLILTLL